jgi:uncharacterized protein (DUF1800 family)
MRNKRFVVLLMVPALVLSASLWAGNKEKDKRSKPAVAAQMDARQRALHALNRLTFGPRPGDVDRVMTMGVDKWFEQQLHPERIDDSAMEARLAPLRTLRMNERQLVENYPPPQLIKAVAEGRLPMPSDPAQRAVYEAQIERYRQRQERKAAGEADAADQSMSGEPGMGRQPMRREAPQDAEQIMALPPEQRMQSILAMEPEERRAFAQSLTPEERAQIMNSLTPEQRERTLAMRNPQRVILTELMQAKVLRAAYSERQLEEVMTDFWYNHFNVFIGKGPDRYLVNGYERDVIRPHALGKFQDLLVATAKSPAMLFYLDNWQSVGPDSAFVQNGGRRRPFGRRGNRRFTGQDQQRPAQQQQRRRGLNENYARELMELHTLGVDGGYTQKDVTEVAKVFTGWTIRRPRMGGGYQFNERMHEPGAKMVLGHKIKEHGEKEGMEVLEMLAHSPATAHFVSKKLAVRFVSDDPPPPLVERMAQTFLKSDGDIREVLRAMWHAPEFWAPEAYRAKVKTPLEFLVSAVRGSGADVRNALPFVQALNQMGMPLYGAQPPTGYSMKAETWVNSAALLNRMNFALRFASGRMPGVRFDAQQVLGTTAPPADGDQALALLENALLAGEVSRQTHDTIRKQLDDPQVTERVLDDPSRPPNLGVIAGLLLGSPEFQRR